MVNLATYNCVIHFTTTALTYANAYSEFAPFFKNIFKSAGGSLLSFQVDEDNKAQGELILTASLAGTTGAPSGNGLLGILEFTVLQTDETNISFGPSLTQNFFISTAGISDTSYPTDLRAGIVNPTADSNISDKKVVTLNGKNAKSVSFGTGTKSMTLQFNTTESSGFTGRLLGQRHTPKHPASGPNVLSYYWKVSTEQAIGTFSAMLTFYYDDADVSAAGLNESQLILGRYDSGTWTIMPTTRDTENNTLSTTTDTFSDWVIAGEGGPTSVELSSFSAVIVDGIVILKWHTEVEIDNAGFALYRNAIKDGNYIKIGFFPAAEDWEMSNDYQFTDKEVEAGKTYFYYLEDIDLGGEKNQSDIIKVVVPSGEKTPSDEPIIEVVVPPAKPVRGRRSVGRRHRTALLLIPKEFRLLQNYPNPFNPETWLPYKLAQDTPIVIRIYNAKGQLVRLMSLGMQRAGVYLTKDKAAYWDGRNS